jgi:hypothetical protein
LKSTSTPESIFVTINISPSELVCVDFKAQWTGDATRDRNLTWTITAQEYPPTIHNRGYSATREQAMADFKAQWLQSP